jgi:cell division septum initiation protein DivIVA
VKATREKFAVTHAEEIRAAQARITELDARIGKFMEMASMLSSPVPALRKVGEVESERAAIEARIVEWEKEDEAAQVLSNVTEGQVRSMLGRMADEMRLYDRTELRDFLQTIIDRVELDPDASTLQLCYRIPLRSGLTVASPRESRAIPTVIVNRLGKVA